MTPLEAKAAAKRDTKRIQQEYDRKKNPLKHIDPLLLDETHRLWNA
jgi:hypothetical protein